jgi:hypothetical protein
MKPLLLALLLAAAPAFALDPERREVTVISGRVWEGYQYTEMFLPSEAPALSVMAGQDSAISFVRTQEYYWPLSRQVYVDFESQRDPVPGLLRIEQNGQTVAEVAEQVFSIEYPEGAVNGNGRLLWGEEAEQGYAAYRQSEIDFNRQFVAAQRAQTAYEQALLKAARAGSKDPIPPPPPLPQPSLRLVTPPMPGFRIALEPGSYQMALLSDGTVLPGTERDLRVIAVEGLTGLVADILPEERWTRPYPSNSRESRIYARAGSTFYVTLAEATRFREVDYLSVVSPQATASTDRELWVRRKPSDIAEATLLQDNVAESLDRSGFKVEQTSSSGFGYTVRPTLSGETPDLEAFAITVPSDGPTRMRINAGEGGFDREVVAVGQRNGPLAALMALVPILAFAGIGLFARRRRTA